MRIYTLSSKDEVHRYKKSIVVEFAGRRKVLSTAPLNGGYQTELTGVFNNDGNPGAGMSCVMRAPTYEEHMAIIAKEDLGLDPRTVCGIGTAASMDNVSIQSETYDDFTVTAIVTGGIEVNGGRVGDPASWHEKQGKTVDTKLGTINIILFIDADLTEGALTRAVVTCTEAKTAAIQELLAPSRYSMGLATGSGTDGTILISNAESDVKLTNAGKHSKLGEYIGRTVKAAVKEALNLQSGLCPDYQHHVIRRMDRFGMTEDRLWMDYSVNQGQAGLSRLAFTHYFHEMAREKVLVTYTSLYAHLLDQLSWGLLDEEEAAMAGRQLRILMGMGETAASGIGEMIQSYCDGILSLITKRAEEEKNAEY